MLFKCCTEYASKFRKLISGHRTGKDQFSFQSQRKAMPKNVQTTTQEHSSHTLLLLSHFSRVRLRPHRQQPTRLPRPWDSPGKNTGVGCHFLLQCMKVKSGSEVAQSCPTLWDSMDCRLPGSSIHGIFQARVLEWGAIAFSHLTLKQSNFELA